MGASLSLVVVAEVAPDIGRGPLAWAWGMPFGSTGVASDAEIRAALDAPSRSRGFLGRFVLGSATADSVRLVVGPEMVHTLKSVSGPTADVVATSGVLAALLSDRTLEVAATRVGEYLVSDVVIGEDELVEGVRTIDEASTVEIRPSEVTVQSYWPIEERLRVEASSSPADLWEHARHVTQRAFATESSWLSLTSGRDSCLLAGAAAASRQTVNCFTFGPPAWWEVRGAAAACEAAGFLHTAVTRANDLHVTTKRIESFSPWTDGLATARDLAGAKWKPRLPDVTMVTGHGGEIGRAFYWKSGPAGRDEFVARFGAALPEPWRSIAQERVAQELQNYSGFGSDATALDVFYARNRVRKWTCRGLRRPELANTVHGFGDPRSVQLLLGAPEEARRDGSFFAHALSLDPIRLHEVAQAAAAARAGSPRSSAPRLLRLARDRTARDLVRLSVDSAARGSFVARTFGASWWLELIRRALHANDLTSRRMLWNALAVDGLARVIAKDFLP